jgi:hypothetical protein
MERRAHILAAPHTPSPVDTRTFLVRVLPAAFALDAPESEPRQLEVVDTSVEPAAERMTRS